jgi:hypothetical protein
MVKKPKICNCRSCKIFRNVGADYFYGQLLAFWDKIETLDIRVQLSTSHKEISIFRSQRNFYKKMLKRQLGVGCSESVYNS